MAKQVLKKTCAPFGRRRSPSNLQAAGDGVATFARAETVLPTEALCLESFRFRLMTDVRRRRSAVCFAKGMTAGDERDRFFVIHGHAFERFPDVCHRKSRVRVTVRSLWVDVDQTHLHCG